MQVIMHPPPSPLSSFPSSLLDFGSDRPTISDLLSFLSYPSYNRFNHGIFYASVPFGPSDTPCLISAPTSCYLLQVGLSSFPLLAVFLFLSLYVQWIHQTRKNNRRLKSQGFSTSLIYPTDSSKMASQD